MKKIDITSNVMSRVIGWEKRRTVRWIVIAVFLILLLAMYAAFRFIVVEGEFTRMGTWDLFGILREDFQTIREFGGEVIQTIWLETPQEDVLLGAATTVLLIGLIIYFLRRKKVVAKRLKEVLEYQQRNDKN